MDGETILFAGAHYEVNLTSGAITKYYFAGASRIAMRKYTIPVSMEVEYLLGDHLGSTSLTTDSVGNKVSEIRYKPWGETRYTWTDPSLDTSPAYAVTRYQYTGQFSYEAEFGLYFYNARWYDSQLGRFAQADTLVPGGVQGYDRYAYVNNSPMSFVDPDGHNPKCGPDGIFCGGGAFVHPIHPTPRPKDLDDIRGTTGISGNDFYNWYLELWYTPGWWWDMFGQDRSGVTVWDAFAVVYVFETNGHWSDPNLSEAAIRDANDWCRDPRGGGGGSCTTGGYINHFAHEYQSAGNWVNAGPPPNPYEYFADPSFTSADEMALRNVSASFARHPAGWNQGCTANTPCGWANNMPTMYPQNVMDKLHSNQNALFVYSPNDLNLNPWFIPSGCVAHFWLEGEIDVYCDLVR